MGFDFSNATGEAVGDIKDVFFKKDGKPIVQEQVSPSKDKVNLHDLSEDIKKEAQEIKKSQTNSQGATIINISKDIIGTEEDKQVVLTEIEEKRFNTSSVRNKEFIQIDTGENVSIVEKTEMYNGTFLYTVKHENGKMITYPRGMFIGPSKKFVPKDYYIREAERSLEDTIDNSFNKILETIRNQELLVETPDFKYLELLLDEPLPILGGIIVPDKIQIPVKRMFDLDYKLMMLENVICLDNKIASLLFIDIWF